MRTLLHPILFSLLAMALLAACSNDYAASDQSQSAAGETTAQAGPAFDVAPPFSGLALNESVFTIEDHSQPQRFELPGGTTLEVPAYAFSLPDGSPVGHPVRLRFQEFHEAAEIIAAGIPMRVKGENGEEGWMQTAGMFEISASSQGQEVDIAEGKSIGIGFVSAVDGDYDFWLFDEAAGNWENQGAGATPTPFATQTTDEATVQRLRQTAQNPPEDPAAAEAEQLGFTDLDVSHIPELQGQTTLVLAYAGKDKSLAPSKNSWVRTASWLRKEIEPTSQAGIYQLTLLGEKRYSIPVKAAPQGKDLERAKARYQQKMQEYQAAVAALRDIDAVRGQMQQQQQAFRRAVTAEATGLYNYDILIKMEDAVPLMADFDFGDMPEALKEAVAVYLITGEGRVVVNFPKYDWHRFRFLPDMDNKLLAVLPQNRVAVFSQEQFAKQRPQMLNARGRDYTFDMRAKIYELESLEHLQAIIQEAG